MEDNRAVPQKIKNKITVWSNNSILGIYKQKDWSSLKDYLYTYVQSSIIHNGQKLSKPTIHQQMSG